MQWLPTEELLCPLAGDELCDAELHVSDTLQSAPCTAVQQYLPPLIALRDNSRSAGKLQTLHHADGKHEVSLNPGTNELRFQASPVKAGLYAARSIAAQLGSLRLALPLLPPAPLRSTAGSWTRLSGEGAWPCLMCLRAETPSGTVGVSK